MAQIETETEKIKNSDLQTPLKQKFFDFAMWMLKQGVAQSTIEMRAKILRILVRRGANLYNAENIKESIAKQPWGDGRKLNAVYAYSAFLIMVGGRWDPPHYEMPQTICFIPTEQEIDALIAGCGKRIATLLQLMKETAFRFGEAFKLRWSDVDVEHNVILLNNPEKGSLPRMPKVSERLLGMIMGLPRKDERIFGRSEATIRNNFAKQRKRVANKLQNPRILQIHFHTLRHWKATMIAHQTKDPFYVQEFLGHKDIRNTMKYIHLAEKLFKESSNDFICKVAKNIKEAIPLIEAGFEKHDEFNGVHIYRKRK